VIVCLAITGPSKSVLATDHEKGMAEPVFKNYKDMKWERILPDLGESSPEICILDTDKKTKATKLLIRSPKAIHIRKHWHSANETHMMIAGTAEFACDGKRVEQGPGSFNYLPAKMVHETRASAAGGPVIKGPRPGTARGRPG